MPSQADEWMDFLSSYSGTLTDRMNQWLLDGASSNGGVMGASNFNGNNTRKWQAGLARAGRIDYGASKGVFRECWIGDSVVGGCTGLGQPTQPDGSTARFDRLNAVSDFSARSYSEELGIPLATTGLVLAHDSTYNDYRLTYTGYSPSAGSRVQALSTGRQVNLVTNVAGDSVDVFFYDNFTTSRLRISINGATSGADILDIVGTNNSKWKMATLSRPVNVGDTVSAVGTNATAVQVLGICVRDNSKGGIIPLNMAASGVSIDGGWSDNSSGFSLIRPILDGGMGDIDVVHIGTPFFDVANNNPSSYKNALNTVINLLKTYGKCDIVLHAYGIPGQYNTNQTMFKAYLDALYSVARDQNLPVFDVGRIVGNYSDALALGLNADNTAHYLQPYYAMWGRSTARMVMG